MFAATQPPQSQPEPQQQAAAPPSAEEEALKRNTDCVYFLASPLTCKKGSECEYRHSEYARVNPKDCYYWLNGNCLNPKCGFRHPPLDGLFGTQAAASTGSTLPPSHTMAVPAVHTNYNPPGKQQVPCIFYQKGLCLKGDRCAFLHGPNPTGNKAPQPTASAVNTAPQPPKKAFGGLQKCTSEEKIVNAKLSNVFDSSSEVKHVTKAEVAPIPIRKGVVVERNVMSSKSMDDDDVPRHKPATFPPAIDGNISRSNRLHQSQMANDNGFQNGKDAIDLLRESSPGFDVLVDDELGNSDYYHEDDHHERTIDREGRNSNAMDDYDMGHGADYGSGADIDLEKYRDPRGYAPYESMQGYAWEKHRVPSDRMLGGGSHLERGGYSMHDSPERIDELDLRYRLSKQSRSNGLRSVVSREFAPNGQIEEQGLQGSRPRQLPSHENSISSRFRGRIKLPGRSPNRGDKYPERETDRGRNWGRTSPGRMQTSHQGRLRDRIKGLVEEDNFHEGRNLRGQRMRREMMDDRSNNFSAPKSLADLKPLHGRVNEKTGEGRMQQSIGKRKHWEDQPSEGDLSFKGPLPLSEILKRKKREADGKASRSGNSPANKQKESMEHVIESSNNSAFEQIPVSSVVKDENNNQVPKEIGESKSTAVENNEVAGDHSTLQPKLSEEGMIGDDGMEDQEYEGEYQNEGDYEYEQVDEGEYNYEEAENEEYVDDEDGDEFAKKIGVLFS